MKISIKDWQIENMDDLIQWLFDASDWEYAIQKRKKKRSNQQNRYYRWLLQIVEKETGVPKEETHEKMKMKFLYVAWDGKSLPYCKSTSKLKTDEFVEYIDKVVAFMSEFGIVLPTPEEYENYF